MNGIKLCRENAIPLSGDEGLPALQQHGRKDARGCRAIDGSAGSRFVQKQGI